MNKKTLGTIESFRRRIQALEDKQTKLFEHCCEILGLDPDKVEGTVLFDILYNGFTKLEYLDLYMEKNNASKGDPPSSSIPTPVSR